MTEWPVPSSACGPVGSMKFCLRQRDSARPLRDESRYPRSLIEPLLVGTAFPESYRIMS